MYLNKAIVIGNLTRDPEVKSLPSGIQYVGTQGGVVDVKGHRTEVYLIKKRLMRHVHGIEIEEV